jgi:hypothetical protein
MEDSCDKFPCFNIEDEKYGIYCSKHKKDDMINVTIKYCEHSRQKSTCKDCCGSSICKHDRRKSQCKECHGSGICEHNKRKDKCRECGGICICIHNRLKSRCRECNGQEICEHNRQKNKCKECGGSSICQHNKIRSRCRECGGGSICEHNREKSRCKECGGNAFCIHNKEKSRCKPCGGSQLCKSLWCETRKHPKYEDYCLSCFVNLFPDKPNVRNYKTKEKAAADYVLEQFPDFTWVTDKRIQDGCSKKRPDLLLDLGYQVIVVEIDENQHESYDCSCENKRLMLLSQDLGHRPMVFIRFNPDDYITGDGKVTSCWSLNKLGVCTVKKMKIKEWNERLESLNAQIAYWSRPENKTEKTVEIVQLFYDCA